MGASEGGAADDPLYGDVPGPLAVLPRLVLAGDGVAAPELAVEAGYHLLPALVEDEEGVTVRRRDRRVVITKDSEAWDDIGVPSLVTEPADDLISVYHLAIIRPKENTYGPYLF